MTAEYIGCEGHALSKEYVRHKHECEAISVHSSSIPQYLNTTL